MESSFLLVGCIVFALGVAALVAYGTDKRTNSALQADLEVLDPATDFSKLEQSCIILNATWLYANQTTKRLQNPSRTVIVACVDHFVYQFALLEEYDQQKNHHSEELIYNSELFGVNRTNGSNPKSCNWYNSDIATPLYSPGDQVDCWMPTFEVHNTSSSLYYYNCGNEDCVKVLDPQETWDSYYNVSTSVVLWRLPVGIVAVLVGGLCCCFAHKRVSSSIPSGGE